MGGEEEMMMRWRGGINREVEMLICSGRCAGCVDDGDCGVSRGMGVCV